VVRRHEQGHDDHPRRVALACAPVRRPDRRAARRRGGQRPRPVAHEAPCGSLGRDSLPVLGGSARGPRGRLAGVRLRPARRDARGLPRSRRMLHRRSVEDYASMTPTTADGRIATIEVGYAFPGSPLKRHRSFMRIGAAGATPRSDGDDPTSFPARSGRLHHGRDGSSVVCKWRREMKT
jgi:hypothetical protein